MQTRNPQNQVSKTVAAIVGVLAVGLLVAAQEIAPTEAAAGAEAIPAAGLGYFSAQFQIRHGADESVDLISTF